NACQRRAASRITKRCCRGTAHQLLPLLPENKPVRQGGVYGALTVQQHANVAGKLLPDQCVDALGLVQCAELLQKGLEGFLLGEPLLIINLSGVSRVEGDPQEDEAAIKVFGLFGPVEPTQGAMYAQTQIGMLSVTLLTMALFELLKRHAASFD